ncbi:Guanine nucleotide exchange factor subunit Rich [Eumeta japonica]|uniref:Guanine nucleotide exchange factor subunit Rich n=1 Tax=Eumeta variegata TaxID=151549 RepID=A0A4C1TKN9_EUMVA|nr:Guanine nucleotide exchange factor subunit Rich [Eumeta japonica]
MKKSAAEAHRMLSKTYGEAAISERMCREWFQLFKNGDFDVEDQHGDGREKLLARQRRKGFLHHIVTGDEKCVLYDNPKCRKSWGYPGYASTSTAKPNIHGSKQYNAQPHVTKVVKTYLKMLKWEVLSHPPYSPDVAPLDYHLFQSMAHGLADQHWQFYKEFKEVLVWDGQITRMCCISGTEILVCTTRAHLLRYRWDGSQNRDYSLDLGRIPFSINQQVSKAEPILEDNIHVNDIEYSPLVCGFGITLNDGRAAYLTAPNLKFDPNQVQGIWAPGIDDATCARVNHKFRLIAIGRKNSQVDVFTIDEATGGLELSHTMVLSSKDFPGDPGAVKCMRWTADGRAVALSWERGGISIWSTFGALLMCSLAWDYGLNQDLMKHNPLIISSMEWSTEGYQLWMVKLEGETVTSLIQLDFIKSPLTVNPCMSNQSHLYLQADDKLYVNLEDNLTKRTKISLIDSTDTYEGENGLLEQTERMDMTTKYRELVDDNECRKQWIVLPLPATYIATNWPLRYSAIDRAGLNLCVAGRTGLAHYNCASRRWKLFGNETQEKDFVVTGGMLWWREYIVVGCYSILDGHDEIRFYPREAKLDNKFAKIVRVQSQVFVIDILDDQLVVFGADALVTIYELKCIDDVGNIELRCVQAVDISALSHPACVVSASLCRLQDGPHAPRAPHRHTTTAIHQRQPDSLVINASGRLMMVQREEYDVDEDNNPTLWHLNVSHYRVGDHCHPWALATLEAFLVCYRSFRKEEDV